MLDFIQRRIQKSIDKINKKLSINEEDILEILREVKLALLEADVNLEVVKSFIKQVKGKALNSQIIGKLNQQQTVLKIFKDELTTILGNKTIEIKPKSYPTKIMMVGLQGSGKTTTSAKLAVYFRKKGIFKKPLLVGDDIYRPAARDQLEQLAKQTQTDFYTKSENDALLIATKAIEAAEEHKNDLVIIDTAGRLAIDEQLMDELKNIKSKVKPDYIFLIVDSMSGQDVINTAKKFHEELNLSGTIITKLDSDARGGAALSITHLLQVPIAFIGVSEKITGLELFYPDRMADRILGMGDVLSLIEKASEEVDEKMMKKIGYKMISGKFDLNDLMNSLSQIKKLGKMKSILKLIPGMADKVSDEKIDEAENKFKVYTYLINSMTDLEKKNPKLLKNPTRKDRIIKGSGRSAREYNMLINDFERMSKQMKEMGSNPQIKNGILG
ncbi:signal recognition particle protein [Mycoplasmopsis arginini]|uniref:signal recognition particle protein n=1 Tax=Mycoplasmopsis arginini TaxID=2094 RepID=UPI00227A75BC|nr:signal recognition particle protein [Mycoplasmopsis arginini]MCY2902973.1 signal recognition particle protein [Mycoplasmopsis arginini QMP CG1-2758]MDI3350100.1 signal recognition particle protein [Mycoplasmopsis arginini]MDI3350665.1 signal recognition particle protein [Mycoplasmopsis arginini]MDI3351543.1 signal recognition particle protein [Mycoplasmopsis arginini]MDI3351983.1 signal recognition particle protein [Mycoplasmopsis arginini]